MLKFFFYVLLIVSTGFCNKKVKLVIHPEVSIINSPENQPFFLTCLGANHEPIYFTYLKWFDPKGQEIDNNIESQSVNYKIKHSQDHTLLLHFINPKEALSGVYTCKGLFQEVEELSSSINVTFYQQINWEDCPETQYLTKGDNDAVIRCKVTAKPPASTTWTKDGKELSNRYLRNFNGITVHGIVDEDVEGKYEIEALVSYTGSFKKKSIIVKVHVKPEITSLKSNYEVVEEEETQLSCKATGVPSPQYYWLDAKGRNLSSVGGYNVNVDTGDLVITKVNKIEVQGEFSCISKNSAGTAIKKTYLNVLSKPKIISFQNISSEIKSIVTFNCIANGNPAPEIVIRKDGEINSITSGGNYNIEKTTTGSESKLTLTINNIQRIDDGLYYCIATNKIGRVDSVGHLQVEFKPNLNNTSLNIKTWSNRNVNISCVVESIPNATVTWYFKNTQLYDNELYKIIDTDSTTTYKPGLFGVHYLLIKPNDRDIYGEYTCSAKNKYGISTTKIHLSKAYKPSFPKDIDLSNVSPNFVVIKFFNPFYSGGLPIKKILVKYRKEYDPFQNAKIIDFPFDKDYVLTGLIPRTSYILNFAAENDVGLSDYSQDYRIVMPNERPPDSPTFLFDNLSKYNYLSRPLESSYSDRFDIQWSTPNDNGRKIEIYSIQYYLVARSEEKWVKIGDVKEIITGSNEQLICHLSNLQPNSNYEVELRAKNSIDYSQPSRLVFKTSSYNSDVSYLHQKVSKAITDLTTMMIIIIVVILVALIILEFFLYLKFNYGILYYIVHVCLADSESNQKIKNDLSNAGYSYHCPNDEIRPMMLDKNARNEFKTELENRLRMPKNSAV